MSANGYSAVPQITVTVNRIQRRLEHLEDHRMEGWVLVPGRSRHRQDLGLFIHRILKVAKCSSALVFCCNIIFSIYIRINGMHNQEEFVWLALLQNLDTNFVECIQTMFRINIIGSRYHDARAKDGW